MGYHLNVGVVSRGQGDSVVAKAAYNSREDIVELRTGERKDYSRAKDRPAWSGLFANQNEPLTAQDRRKVWNTVDQFLTRKNAQLAYNFVCALPHQLTDQGREYVIKDFVREQFLRKGVLADVNLHRPDRKGDQRNWHAHILTSMNEFGPQGPTPKKIFKWEDRAENLAVWREAWAARCARELRKEGHPLEADRWAVSHLKLEKQRDAALARGDNEWAEHLDREATKHRGPAVDAMEKKGQETERGNAYRDTVEHNEDRAEQRQLKKQIAELQAKAQPKPWDRDAANDDWMNAVIDAAIAKDENERRQKHGGGRGTQPAPVPVTEKDARLRELAEQLYQQKKPPDLSAQEREALKEKLAAFGFDPAKPGTLNKWQKRQPDVDAGRIAEKDRLREMALYLWQQSQKDRHASHSPPEPEKRGAARDREKEPDRDR
jgi:hypothetical protein